MSRKVWCHENGNFHKTEMSIKLKCHQKWNVTKTELSQKLKCHQNSNVTTRDGRNQANRGRTNPNESWQIWTKPNKPGKTGETGETRLKWAKNRHFQAKLGQKTGETRQKNGRNQARGNWRTKPNPGKTGQNQKFCQILVWFWSSLFTTTEMSPEMSQKLTYHPNWNVTKTEMSPQMKWHQNKKVTKTGNS